MIPTMRYLSLCCLLGVAQIAQTQSIFDASYLHEIRLNFETPHYWDSLTVNYQTWVADQSSEHIYTTATLEIDGTSLENVGARFRGLSSYYFIEGLKKPMKIDLNEFVPNQSYQGIQKFNLHNGAFDPSMMRDFLAYDILRKAGAKAPRMSFARLYINDDYWGLYGIIEQVDEPFVEANFTSNNGTLIKNVGWSELEWLGEDTTAYQENFELKMNDTPEGWATFIHFLDVLNNSPDDIFATEIEKVFDVNLYLHVLATDVLLNNWDSYLDNKRNWYLYHEPASGKMQWIPWDYNLSLGGTFNTQGNPYPPVDPICNLVTDFQTTRDDEQFYFTEISNQTISDWHWDFGDGTTSAEATPSHIFPNTSDVYQVCLTAKYTQFDGSICEQSRCHIIDLNSNPALCFTALAGFSPYPSNDPIFQQVIATYQHCCEEDWDAVCQEEYDAILGQQNPSHSFNFDIDYALDLPLILNDSNKVLVNRILNIPAFKEKYLDIVCVMLDNNFNAQRLFPLLDQQTELIRTAIYEDPNYIYTWDYFEYDAGDGSGGGGEAAIPAIKYVLQQRFSDIANDLNEAGKNCATVFSPVLWQELVVNELMADNTTDSGILDANNEADDWIELYNNTTTDIDLSNFYLSDDLDDIFKWNFPLGTSITAHDYLMIWADKDEVQAGIHSNFKLSKAGEALYLSYEDGTVIDSLSFGVQSTNLSYARRPNGTGGFVMQTATFHANNENTTASSSSQEISPFNIYPNPSHQFITIELASDFFEASKVRLSNIMGQAVIPTFMPQQPKQSINLASLPSGVYLLEVTIEHQKFVKKIILK